MFGKDIVQEIDKTLDQLIQNAEVISHADLTDLSETELEAFQKTQESLLQHLLHMDQFLATTSQDLLLNEKVPLQEKLFKFEKLKGQYSEQLSSTLGRKCRLVKRRQKKFFDIKFRTKKELIPR